MSSAEDVCRPGKHCDQRGVRQVAGNSVECAYHAVAEGRYAWLARARRAIDAWLSTDNLAHHLVTLLEGRIVEP